MKIIRAPANMRAVPDAMALCQKSIVNSPLIFDMRLAKQPIQRNPEPIHEPCA